MNNFKILIVCIIVSLGCSGYSQNNEAMIEQIKIMGKEKNPVKSLKMMKKIIKTYRLNEEKDAETIDMLKGNVAMNYLEGGRYKEFEKTISSMKNKFNQTSYLNMGASNLLTKKTDLEKAKDLAEKTLDLYLSFKDDPSAKPKDYSEADWERFMNFAYFPYCDTYASALYALGKNKEALEYQEKALDGSWENGMSSSIERYANLLALNGQEEKAYSILLKMAETGKSTEGMNKLLKELYLKKESEKSGFDGFLSDLQTNVVSTLKKELMKKMQDIEAPDFSLRDLDGNIVSLSDLKGKIVVLDFWATWCAPCKASFPAMKKAVEKHPEVKFLFIATQENQEGAVERVKKFIDQNQYPFKVLMDEPKKDDARVFQVLSAYKVDGIPTKIIIDANGRQRFVSVGFSSDTELINELEAMIQILQGQK